MYVEECDNYFYIKTFVILEMNEKNIEKEKKEKKEFSIHDNLCNNIC